MSQYLCIVFKLMDGYVFTKLITSVLSNIFLVMEEIMFIFMHFKCPKCMINCKGFPR